MLISQGFLDKVGLKLAITQNRKERTLIVVKITATEPKTAFAGVMLEISFARFETSMNTFKAESTPSRSFGRWEFVAIVETGGNREKVWTKAAKKDPNPNTQIRVRRAEFFFS